MGWISNLTTVGVLRGSGEGCALGREAAWIEVSVTLGWDEGAQPTLDT